MGETGAPLSVLFADISGSSLLCAERGDAVAFSITSKCLDLLESEARFAGARLVKRAGDAIIAVFATPQASVEAAAGMQRAISASALRRDGVHVRVAISRGTAVLTAGDVFGDVVNVAARLVSIAGADEIILSGDAYVNLPGGLRDSTRLIDQQVLYGRPAEVQVYEYLWERGDTTVGARFEPTGAPARLEILCGSQSLIIDAGRPKVTIGRAADNDITIRDEVVSRYHASILLRGNQFLLADRSTNGTYVQADCGEALRVVRDELTLSGSGRILVGSDAVRPIHYRVTQRG